MLGSMVNFLSNLFYTLYSIYAFASFFVTLCLSFLFYGISIFFPERLRLKMIYHYNRVWLDAWGFFSGIVMETRGKEHLDSQETYVIVGNHCNMLDIIIVGSRVTHPFKPLIKKELLAIPVLGAMLKIISVVVDRSSRQSRILSYQRMKQTLKKNISILIFPEGTRNRSKLPLKPFYDGAFKLAIDAQVPILPVALLNVRRMNPIGTFRFYPGRIVFQYLKAIPTQGLSQADLPSIKKQVFEELEAIILAEDTFFNKNHPSPLSVLNNS